jgi:hypothetical protein
MTPGFALERRSPVEDLINTVVQKTGIPAETARKVVEGILGFLKAKLPESAANQLNNALDGGLAKVSPATGSLQDLIKGSGLATDKVPAVLESIVTQLKARVPGPVGDQLATALQGQGFLGGIFQKVSQLVSGKS